MAELATIARPYAEALFKASSGNEEATLAWLEPLAQVAGSPQLQEAAANPKLGAAQVHDLIAGLVPQGLPQPGQNFLRTVLENGRLAAVPEVAAQLRALRNSASGVADAIVYSAFPMDAAALADVQAVLERRFGRRLSTHVQVDASLIGGVRVVVGDEVLDTSVKAWLEQMKTVLTA